MLKPSRDWVSSHTAKRLLIGLFSLGAFFFLYVWRLGTLVPGLSAHESTARGISSSLGNIIDSPINAPHKIVQFIFQTVGHNGAFWMRSASVFFILVFLLSLFFILRSWFGKSIAVAGTLLFATTPWVILTARSAAPDIMMLSPLFLIFTYVALARAKKRLNLIWYAFILAVATCLYVPGLIWFVAAALIVGHKRILPTILRVKGLPSVAGLTLLILMLLPLGYALLTNSSLPKELLLIPDGFTDVTDLGKNLAWSLSSLIFQFPTHVDYTIGNIAIFNVAQIVLAVTGIFAMLKKARPELASLLGLAAIAIAGAVLLNNKLLLTLAIPTFVILDAAGIRFLYTKWFSVFPLNPLARGFAVVMISILILIHIVYGTRFALIAWPHNLEIRKTYVIK